MPNRLLAVLAIRISALAQDCSGSGAPLMAIDAIPLSAAGAAVE